jgi:hypothetical protein
VRDLMGVVVEEGSPALAVFLRWSSLAHRRLHRALADLDAQLQYLPSDPLRSPQMILGCHLPDQGDRLFWDPRCASWPRRPACPDEAKALPVPTQQRLGPYEHEGMPPGTDTGCEDHHEESIESREGWASARS